MFLDPTQKNKDRLKIVMRSMDDNAIIVKINLSATCCDMHKIIPTLDKNTVCQKTVKKTSNTL